MRVLFAWEAGAGFGHVAMILPVAEMLAARGAEIHLCFKSARRLEASGDRFHVVSAPHHESESATKAGGDVPRGMSYSDSLIAMGYGQAEGLAGLVAGWREIYDRVAPDVVVAEYAPTAQLAARGYGFATAAMGTGFTLPPLATPMPALRHWKPHDGAELLRREEAVLATINAALARLGLEPLAAVADMLRGDAEFLCTVPELDHYPGRAARDYLGPILKTDIGAEFEWRPEAGRRVFAYLKPDRGMFEPIMHALGELPPDCDTIAVFPDLPEPIRRQFETPRLRILSRHARLDRLLPGCDLAVHHAGAGIAAAIALAGVPALMLPKHIEQTMTVKVAERAGLGLGLSLLDDPAELRPRLHRLLSDPAYQASARAFARKYQGLDPAGVPARIADAIEALARR